MAKKFWVIVIVYTVFVFPSKSVDFIAGFGPCLHFPGVMNFYKVYSDNRLAVQGNIGIGTNDLMLLAKHQYFQTKGKSVVENAPFTGSALWQQHTTFIGARNYSEAFNGLLYGEIGLLSTFGVEKITTIEGLEELTSSSSFKQFGLGLGAGFDIPLNKNLAINTGCDFGFIFIPSEGGIRENSTVNIGGLTFSIGLVYKLSQIKNEE